MWKWTRDGFIVWIYWMKTFIPPWEGLCYYTTLYSISSRKLCTERNFLLRRQKFCASERQNNIFEMNWKMENQSHFYLVNQNARRPGKSSCRVAWAFTRVARPLVRICWGWDSCVWFLRAIFRHFRCGGFCSSGYCAL